MSKKQTNIIITLVVIVIALFMILGFFGYGGFPISSNADDALTAGNDLLEELQSTGTVSDLRVQIISEGQGDGAKAGDLVTVNYVGLLTDGSVFDASSQHGGAFSFTLGIGQVIPGWDQGIVGMKVGERRLLAIPPSLAYGAQQVGTIPANSTLIFEVELLEIKADGATIAP